MQVSATRTNRSAGTSSPIRKMKSSRPTIPQETHSQSGEPPAESQSFEMSHSTTTPPPSRSLHQPNRQSPECDLPPLSSGQAGIISKMHSRYQRHNCSSLGCFRLELD